MLANSCLCQLFSGKTEPEEKLLAETNDSNNVTESTSINGLPFTGFVA